MNTEDACQLAWAAGLVDGEGCIHYDEGTELWNLAVKMTHEQTIRRLAELFPDGHRPYYNIPAEGNRKNTFKVR